MTCGRRFVACNSLIFKREWQRQRERDCEKVERMWRKRNRRKSNRKAKRHANSMRERDENVGKRTERTHNSSKRRNISKVRQNESQAGEHLAFYFAKMCVRASDANIVCMSFCMELILFYSLTQRILQSVIHLNTTTQSQHINTFAEIGVMTKDWEQELLDWDRKHESIMRWKKKLKTPGVHAYANQQTTRVAVICMLSGSFSFFLHSNFLCAHPHPTTHPTSSHSL